MLRSKSTFAVPPGATIEEQLQDKGMSRQEVAAQMEMSQQQVDQLLNGETKLTPEIAARLETVLGVPAAFWNNRESIYREKIRRIEAENAMDAEAENRQGSGDK